MKKLDRRFDTVKQREENKLLETENREIEERLKLLKSTLYAEISKRNKSSSESIWDSNRSPSTTHKPRSDALIDVSKLRFKTLKPISAPKNKPADIHSDVIQKLVDSYKSPSRNSVNKHRKKCGQCEDRIAVVSCQECSEYYCAKCFATFHMKGALRRHHSVPISTPTSRFDSSQPKEVGEIKLSTRSTHSVSTGCQSSLDVTSKSSSALQTEDIDGLEINQCFDNKRFQEESKKPSTVIPGRNVSTLCKSPTPIEIHFTPSISYAEKLLLHLHRNSKLQHTGNESSTHRQIISGETISANSVDETQKQKEENNEKERILQDFQLNRISFDELHQLATMEVQLNDTLALYPVEDLEPVSFERNEIMNTKNDDKLGENNFDGKLLISETFSSEDNLSEVNEAFKAEQYPKAKSAEEDEEIEKEVVVVNRNEEANEKSVNKTDVEDDYYEEFRNTTESPIQSQKTPSMTHHSKNTSKTRIVEATNEEYDSEGDNEYNSLYDSLG
uniref:B box-type domain-containing protein n=1 Tax=Trichobilharzia regenti TaxID=157069 RepID=A0AA85JX36_TRIRE|nr:unnamed protein product [Trichobilharzia regenti]